METIDELLVKAKERANALERYAVHHASCKRAFNSEQPCTCGLDQLLKGGDVALTPQGMLQGAREQYSTAKSDSEMLDDLEKIRSGVAIYVKGQSKIEHHQTIRQAIRAAIAVGKEGK
jgi:hypothetical protein